MLKTIVSVFVVLGLLSPLCLCGGVASDAHTAVTKAGESCHAAHGEDGHEHRHSDREDPGHSHSHSELRQLASSPVSVPPVPAAELPDWQWLPLAPRLQTSSDKRFPRFDSSGPPVSRRSHASVTSVFLI